MFGKKKRCSCDTAKSVAETVQMQGQVSSPFGLNQYHSGEINELRRMLNAVCDHFGIVIVHETGYKVYKQGDLGGLTFSSGKSKRKK